ncbi:S1C family serine protease [Anaeromyxobacter sp. Fw109-5]|uniref:S1C family serine protease n=1 Tax=Anaeromyxobacter sp. (strain Fw109-5) TaxID=404589 RepID=UPI0000ED7FDE|nr:S1C family serine protease [Anaeromyxobacter sp. Fw109-5]ABS25122.1 peptidase S1 and S6 chymotrypsin/Hap [Anaeromyxobacter sp. Fw109-5]
MEPVTLSALSDELSALVRAAEAHVVRVEGRRGRAASGVAWSADGIVVTAHHVLDRDEEIDVGLPSGERAVAAVVGRDPTTDVAALRVRGAGLSPAAWSDAALAPGALVVGVTRPGKSPRAELAVLARAAGEYRGGRGGRVDRFLETTLPLHPGVSGGLAVSAKGAPLGLLSSGLVRGSAMILPPETLRRVVKSLLAHGEVRRGYLGLATLPVSLPAPLRAATGEHVALLVTRVEPESPAARAGILLGDALLSFGGDTLQDPSELLALLAEDRIGDAVPMKVLRAGEVRDVTVTVGARGHGRAA